MPDESTGSPGEGPPSFPGASPPPPMPPPMAPPAPPSMPPPPPSYPTGPGGYPPPQYGAPTVAPFAGWGIRLGGWLIDAVIFIVVQLIVGAILRSSNVLTLHYTTNMHNGTIRHNRIDFLVIVITVILAIAYATALIGGRGQTVGMMAVGIRAVTDGTQDGAVSHGKAFGRALLEQVLRFTVIIWILDMLWPLWDGKNQTLHDKAAGTVVLRVRYAG